MAEGQVAKPWLIWPGDLPESESQVQRAGCFQVADSQTDLQLRHPPRCHKRSSLRITPLTRLHPTAPIIPAPPRHRPGTFPLLPRAEICLVVLGDQLDPANDAGVELGEVLSRDPVLEDRLAADLAGGVVVEGGLADLEKNHID